MRVEGVTYQLLWDKFSIGSSFFIPCLDDNTAKQYVKTKMDRLGYAVIIKTVIEDEVKGLRVWRTKRII